MLKELNAAYSGVVTFRRVLGGITALTFAAWAVQGLCHIFLKTPYYQDAEAAMEVFGGISLAHTFIKSLIDHAITRSVFIDVELNEADAFFTARNEKMKLQVGVPQGSDPAALADNVSRSNTRAIAEAALSGRGG